MLLAGIDHVAVPSVVLRAPDGLECGVRSHDPEATGADVEPPGTPAAGDEPAG